MKDRIMYNVVYTKFSQNEDLKTKLLQTEDEYLVEGNTWNDNYWGRCNPYGLNRLGLILQLVLDEIRNNCNHQYAIESDELNELLLKYK